MAKELKAFTVNLKSLDQDIEDPIVASAGDANGRTFRVIFDEEAKAQMTEDTKVYLSWFHKQAKVKGYNVFTKVSDEPLVWEIKWPKAMLRKGDVLACIEIVDDVSIAASTNFIVHVLEDPNDGSQFVTTDDFSVFQNAVIELNCIGEQAKRQIRQQRIEFEDMMLQLGRYDDTVKEIRETADRSQQMAQEAYDKVQSGAVTHDDLDKAIEDAHHLTYVIVDELPESGKDYTMYLLSLGDDAKDDQRYEEYLWVTDHFERIGDTASDLANYVTLDQLYSAKDETLKKAESYSDGQLDTFKESFTKETTDTITKMGEDIQTKANEYAKGYGDKVLADAKEYTDSLSESIGDLVGLDDLPEGKSVKDYIDETAKSVTDKLGDIPEGQTVRDYVDAGDKAVSDSIGELPEGKTMREYVDSLVGDITPDETVSEHIKNQVQEAQPDLMEFF